MNLQFIYKYQPLYLKDFEIDKNLLFIIKSFLSIDSLNLLFVGNQGTGKTTLINAIIREYYDKNNNYNENILEINSLKEQGIAYYRNDVKTFCQTPSTIFGKKKFVILDDIDIINEQSQQVFRNCIDKYSNNVNFIASCINTQKVLDSLQSRMNIIKIPTFTFQNLLNIVNTISKNENINITDNAKKLLISISNYSIKALINYLEKINLLNFIIDDEIIYNICTNITYTELIKYTNLCKINKDLKGACKIIYEIYDKGYSVIDILDSYFIFIKNTEILSEKEKYLIIPLICKYITIFNNIHEDEIELSLFTHSFINLFN